MSALIDLSIKGKDGQYTNYTISISDETNQWGQNVTMYLRQTKEERDTKQPKKYVGNGRVLWNSGTIVNAVPNDARVEHKESNVEESDGLPF